MTPDTLRPDIAAIRARLSATPALLSYATTRGGVVILNGPFEATKAEAAVEFVAYAAEDIDALLAWVGRLEILVGLGEDSESTSTHSIKETHMPFPNQPLQYDERGTLRFQGNKIVQFLLDAGPFDMNQLARMSFSDEDRMQFAQLIGYSLSGFGELSYVTDEVYEIAANQAPITDKS